MNLPLSASSIYYDPEHPPYSIYVLNSLFAQPVSKSSLVYLSVWHPPLHIPYISSPNHWITADYNNSRKIILKYFKIIKLNDIQVYVKTEEL